MRICKCLKAPRKQKVFVSTTESIEDGGDDAELIYVKATEGQ